MKCTKCGKEYDGNFCPYCGEPSGTQNNVCPKCGRIRNGEERFCSNCGYEFTKDEPNKFVKLNTTSVAAVKRVPKKAWIAAGIAVAVIVVLLAVLIPTISHLTNKFRIDVVERISIGDKKQDVLDLLGEPYDYEENSSLFTYYSDDYRKLLEKNDSFNPDDIGDWNDFEDAFQEALELEQKLQTEEYKYIEVRFDGEGAVTSVFFDNLRTEQIKDQAKTIESFDVLSDTASILNIADSIQFTARYTDGSYYMSDSVTTLNIESEPYSISWRDRFGNDLEYPLSETAIGDSLYNESTHTLQVFTNEGFVDIPRDVENVIIYNGVTSIGGRAFYEHTALKSVTIGGSVTSIGESAFYNCESLTSIVIPDNVTSIDNSAFSGCGSLTILNIGTGVTNIGDRAFYGCESLLNITIPDSITNIGRDAFSECTNITEATLPISAISYIPKNNLQSIAISSGTIIYANTFIGFDLLKTVIIGDNVTNVTSDAFTGRTSLTNIAVEEGNKKYHSSGNCIIETASKTLIVGCKNSIIPNDGSITTIGDHAFYNCDSLTNIIIPDGVTTIGERAFEDCDSLSNINLPDSLAYIGDFAFQSCISLTNVTIPEGVTKIGKYAFSRCHSLTSVTIPDSVTSIGDNAFGICDNITEATIPTFAIDNISRTNLKTVIITRGTTISDNAFKYCASLISITIPNSVTNIGKDAFIGCTSLRNVYITDVTAWCNIDFYYPNSNPLYYANNLYLNNKLATNLIIPDGVTAIGDYAFYSCDSLTNIIISDGVATIGDHAFYNCDSLTNINLPDSLEHIDDGAFGNCDSLTSITIPNSITIINTAFSECSHLTSITIPDSVIEISMMAFFGCTSLETVYYTGTESQWNKIYIDNTRGSNNRILEAEKIYNYKC